jgi:hypothetical protein
MEALPIFLDFLVDKVCHRFRFDTLICTLFDFCIVGLCCVHVCHPTHDHRCTACNAQITAVLLSVTAVLLMGEVIPQAVCSKWVGGWPGIVMVLGKDQAVTLTACWLSASTQQGCIPVYLHSVLVHMK